MQNLDQLEDKNKCENINNLRSYELTLLCFNQYNDEIIKKVITDVFSALDTKLYEINKINDIVRYDIIYARKQIKTNMITVYFNSCPNIIDRISLSVKKQDKVVIKHIILAHYKLKNKMFDYKKPISMKKHFFESQRLMPIELTGLTKKQHRAFSKHAKIGRVLGFFGNANKIIK
ncbi:30S ribosomal protein S18 [uncultured bacterium]|nr:30S ribosomal protein S18 [uncultured bacterium]